MDRSIPGLIIGIALLAGFACSSNKTEIKGFVAGGKENTLTLERLDVNRTSLIDSVKINGDGSFNLKTKQEEPELYILKNKEGKLINLLLSPGDRIRIHTDYSSFGQAYQVEGSEESEGIRQLVYHLDHTRKNLDSLLLMADSINNPESPEVDLIRNAYAQAIIKQKRFTIKYLIENMTSLSTVYALYQKYDQDHLVLGLETDLQYFKSVADSLESVHPNSSLTKSLRADINLREARYNKAIQLNNLMEMAGEASGMLDLSIPDREGNEISLSDLKGKVILVTFWASASEESIRMLLQLKSTYQRFHPLGFEVYAISMDNNKTAWMRAMDFNEFDWINVSELSYPESRAALIYNVTAIPTFFLINREGEIVAKNLYGRNLETWLDNLI